MKCYNHFEIDAVKQCMCGKGLCHNCATTCNECRAFWKKQRIKDRIVLGFQIFWYIGFAAIVFIIVKNLLAYL